MHVDWILALKLLGTSVLAGVIVVAAKAWVNHIWPDKEEKQ
jgi:hypothetical protein